MASSHYYDLDEDLHSPAKLWYYKPDGGECSAAMLPLREIIALSVSRQGQAFELYDETGFRCGFVTGAHVVIR